MKRSVFKRVEKQGTAAQKVGGVSCGNGHAMDEGRRSQICVLGGKLLVGTEPTPDIRHFNSDWDDSRTICELKLLKPPLKHESLGGVRVPDTFDASAYFRERGHAQPHAFLRQAAIPFHDPGCSATALPHLGNNIGVEQVNHSQSKSTGARSGIFMRGSLRSNTQSISSGSSGMDMRCSFIVGLADDAAPNNTLASIRRCSSSADTPCSAALFFRARTVISSTFLTKSWGIPERAINDSACQAGSRSPRYSHFSPC